MFVGLVFYPFVLFSYRLFGTFIQVVTMGDLFAFKLKQYCYSLLSFTFQFPFLLLVLLFCPVISFPLLSFLFSSSSVSLYFLSYVRHLRSLVFVPVKTRTVVSRLTFTRERGGNIPSSTLSRK